MFLSDFTLSLVWYVIASPLFNLLTWALLNLYCTPSISISIFVIPFTTSSVISFFIDRFFISTLFEYISPGSCSNTMLPSSSIVLVLIVSIKNVSSTSIWFSL